jgi:hypothetical protein
MPTLLRQAFDVHSISESMFTQCSGNFGDQAPSVVQVTLVALPSRRIRFSSSLKKDQNECGAGMGGSRQDRTRDGKPVG